MQAPSRVMPKKETSLTVCDNICPAVGRFWDDSVIIVIVSEGRGWGARKSFLGFMAMDIGEGEAWSSGSCPSMSSVRPIHSSKTNRNGKNGGERIGGGGVSLRWSVLNINAAADTYSLARTAGVLRWRGERGRKRERKERNIDNGFWGRCPFSFRAAWMDGSTQCPVTPSSSHSQYYVRQCCKLVFIRTSLATDNTTEADEMPMSFRGFLNIHFNLTFLKPNCTDVYSNLFWSKTSLSAKTTLGILLLEPDFRPFRSERH